VDDPHRVIGVAGIEDEQAGDGKLLHPPQRGRRQFGRRDSLRRRGHDGARGRVEQVHARRSRPPDVAVGDDPDESPIAADDAGHPQPLRADREQGVFQRRVRGDQRDLVPRVHQVRNRLQAASQPAARVKPREVLLGEPRLVPEEQTEGTLVAYNAKSLLALPWLVGLS